MVSQEVGLVWAGGEPTMPMANDMVSIIKDLKRSGELEERLGEFAVTEQQARDRNGNRVEVTNWPMAQVDRALTDGASGGFVKLVHQPNGRLLGATVVSRRAGEMIHEWILALDQGRKVGDLTNSIHVYPTYSMANMQVSSQIRVAGLLSGASGRIVRKLARLMR